MFLRRGAMLASLVVSPHVSRVASFKSRAATLLDNDKQATQGTTYAECDNNNHLSPLFSHSGPNLEGCNIELVDTETWRISSSLAEVWRETDKTRKEKFLLFTEAVEVADHSPRRNNDDPDFDEIEDMRLGGNLFYKLDRDSKEFEEYSYDFHRRKSSKSNDDQRENKMENSSHKRDSKVEKSPKKNDGRKESRKMNTAHHYLDSAGEGLSKLVKNVNLNSPLSEIENSCSRKKLRTPTFNQLTAPYHEPFCLDIYISKASVRACIIHRATSKVVAVAHSISKDMKFNLGSTKNATACAAVGEFLAQRALADDIHNVVYTPRKGEKLEGKLQVVLQSIIDNHVNVKLKIKQTRVKKAGRSSTGRDPT